MLCWLYRSTISNAADSGSPISRWTSRHIARCASCGQFLENCRTIDACLRSEAAEWQGGLEQPSGRMLPNPARARMQSPSHGFPIRTALAAAACLAIAAAVLFSFAIPAGPPQPSPAIRITFIPAGAPWAMQWVQLIPNPLALEAERLTRDTESGIRFVVACLDVRPLGARVSPGLSDPMSPSQ
jgi:hypothetical protein